MQGNQGYKSYKENAKNALRMNSAYGKTSASVLAADLKKASVNIFSLWKKACELDIKGLQFSEDIEWIYDNRYLWEEVLKSTVNGLYSFGRITGTKPSKGQYAFKKIPRFYAAFSDYTDICKYDINETAIDAFISACDKNTEKRPDFSDFFSLKLLFSAVIIEKLSCACEKLLQGRAPEKKEELPDTGKLTNALRCIWNYSFERCIEKSETEEYLRLDPAGFYSIMTPETKAFYRSRISEIAVKQKKEETEVAREILEKARNAKDEKMRHIGAYLYPPKNKFLQNSYFTVIAVSVCIITAMLCSFSPVGIFFIFTVWEGVKQMLDKLYASFVKPVPLPCLDLENIPDTDGVLAVITTLLNGKEKDAELFSRLEDMYLSNGMKNVYFAILGDLPDSTSAYEETDKETIDFAKKCISELNEKYGTAFFLFIRKRRLSGEKYSGKERKRGAVCELVKYLCGKTCEDFIRDTGIMQESLCNTIRFVLTLDSDTNIPPDSIRTLAGAMLHPLNKPVIDKKTHTVVSGYGIMQPKISPDLDAAVKTGFASIMCGAGGIDVYAFAGFDLYQSVFSEASFCGKGIFDKYAFDEVINRECIAFPENTVLSHDILEGARLRTALIQDIEITDGFPSNPISFYKRQHRWIRGDVQNLLFTGNTFENVSGERVKNGISPLSKFKIFDNVRRALLPVISFVGIIVASFLQASSAAFITVVSLFCYIFPFVSDFSGMISTFSVQCAARRFFSKGIFTGIWQSFMRALYEISALPYNALISADAVIRSLYRAYISKKNMLEWITAANAEASSATSLPLYIQKNLPGSLIGTALFVFSPYGIMKIIGLMWFLFPITAYNLALPAKEKKYTVSEQALSTIKVYCRDMWKYFKEYAVESTGYLPPDNIMLFPSEKVASYTSSTNIGLYLASVLCARDFGFIGNDEMCSMLENTIDTIEKLHKWHGHLFNWYSIETLDVIQPAYISTVDSGNFIACLICLKEGLREYTSETEKISELIKRIEKLISDTDFSELYDKKNKLLYQGVSIENGYPYFSPHHYDMLMSEARSASYIAISKRDIPPKHWSYLSRPLIKHSHRIGVASWSGTAFEYFMPQLFMPTKKGSLMYEAMYFAFTRQLRRTAKTFFGNIFGISESAYSVIDSDGNYSYKAFGIPELGIKKGLEKELVISPYSSFLMLNTAPKSIITNLKKLKKNGLYGKFGFYEAYDFTDKDKPKIVKSYMSHHIGMSMLACANFCFDGIFISRFMNNPHTKSIRRLTEEKIPVNAVVTPIRKRSDKLFFPRTRPSKKDGKNFFEKIQKNY